jgi:uncharacterized protein DUF4321
VAKRIREPWWVLVLVIIAGAVLGSVLADALGQFTYLAALGHTIALGVDPPLTLDLHIVSLTVGFTLRLSLAIVLGIVLAVYLFRAL